MYTMIFLLAFSVFSIGVLVGVRCQEINVRGRERRIAEQRRRMNERIRSRQQNHEINNISWQPRNEFRRDELGPANDISSVLDRELEALTIPRQRNGTKKYATQKSSN